MNGTSPSQHKARSESEVGYVWFHPARSAVTDVSALHSEHERVARALDALSPEARLWRPAPGAWHAADVLEHLVKTEKVMLRGVRRHLAAGDARRDLGAPAPEAAAALTAFLRSGRRTRVPTAAARWVAPEGAPYDGLRTEWDALPGLWRDALREMPEGLKGVTLTIHPVAGPLTAEGVLTFLADHAHHHLGQLARLRAAPGFPA